MFRIILSTEGPFLNAENAYTYLPPSCRMHICLSPKLLPPPIDLHDFVGEGMAFLSLAKLRHVHILERKFNFKILSNLAFSPLAPQGGKDGDY